MKRFSYFLIIVTCLFTLTSCLIDISEYCFHLYPETYEYDDDYHYQKCRICQKEVKEYHDFDEGEIILNASSYTDIEYECYVCGFTKVETKYKTSNEHEHTFSKVWSYDNVEHWHEATCGHDFVADVAKHSFSDYVYNNDATEETNGTETAYCDAECGASHTREKEGSKLDHVHVFNIKDDMATHFAADATCQHGLLFYYSCECDENGSETFEVSEKLDHKYSNYVYNYDATTEKDGTETAYCDFGCGNKDTRVKEGTKLEPVHTHVFDQKVAHANFHVAMATCQHGSKFYYSCVCGEKGTEIFEDEYKMDHTYTLYDYNYDATEEANGTETAPCDYGCGLTHTREKEGTKLQHTHVFNIDLVNNETYAGGPNCQRGESYYYSCRCGEIGTNYFEVTDKSDHRYSYYVYNNDATEEANGTETAACDFGCGMTHTREKEGSKLEHIHVFDLKIDFAGTLYKEGNCMHGYMFYYSCACGALGTETFEMGEPLEHWYTEFVYNNDATTEADGTETASCNYGCGTTYTRIKEGTKIEHIHVYDQEVVLAHFNASMSTCDKPASFYYSCVCGQKGIQTFEYGDPLGHSYTCTYFWLNNNASVSAIGICSTCRKTVSEEVGTEYEVITEATTELEGLGRYYTLPFESDAFTTQYKEIVIKKVSISTNGNSTYGYNDLANYNNSEGLQALYNRFESACVEFSKSTANVSLDSFGHYSIDVIDISEYGLGIYEAFAVWSIYYIEHPAYYWLANTTTCYGDSLLFMIDESYISALYRAECDSAIASMIEDCSEYIKDAKSELEKAKLIHDFIVYRIDYAYEADGRTPQDDIWAHNIVGAAKYDFGVCETYAKTYLLLCLLNGIDCIIVIGDGGGPHAWNYVSIDGYWYAVDCTWNDQTYGVIYDYFGVDKEFFLDHTPNSNKVLDGDFLYKLPELSDNRIVI